MGGIKIQLGTGGAKASEIRVGIWQRSAVNSTTEVCEDNCSGGDRSDVVVEMKDQDRVQGNCVGAGT